VGIALLGIGQALGIPDGMIAGAIISGAYFGDKVSPLSDTTNLAPAMVGTDIFSHVRHMLYTSVPSILIAILGFFFLGFFHQGKTVSIKDIDEVLNVMSSHFNISLWLMILPIFLIVFLVVKKVPAIPTMLAGIAMGIIFAVVFQPSLLNKLAPSKFFLFSTGDFKEVSSLSKKITDPKDPLSSHLKKNLAQEIQKGLAPQPLAQGLNTLIQKESLYHREWFTLTTLSEETQKLVAQNPQDFVLLNRLLLEDAYPQEIVKSSLSFTKMYMVLITTAGKGFKFESGNQKTNELFNRGGMSSMLNTIWLIIAAMIFGGAMEGTGMLQKIASSILKLVRGTGTLIGATLASCLIVNATACDQYLAIVIPGRMFKEAYEKFGLHPKNLSRALEDSGTVTSVLVPWNSCGAYNSGVLNVTTLTYLPYCFFNLASPLVSAFLAAFNITITKLDTQEKNNA
jgi:NhaC family Na+:H+ antiporter